MRARRLLLPWGVLAAVVGACAIALGVLWFAPSGDYLLLPDRPHPLDPLVTVRGQKPDGDGGGIYFVDALVRKASLLESWFPGIHHGAALVPTQAFNPPGFGERQLNVENARAMQTSQQVATAVALRALGYHVVVKPTGVRIDAVDPNAPAAGKLIPTDVIVAVDGRPVRTPLELRRAIRRHRPGQTVVLTVRGGSGPGTVRVGTIPDPTDPARPLIGVIPAQAVELRLPLHVRFDLGDVGGPSAGLAFALELTEKLGRDVDRGRRVAATGEIGVDGSVGAVGGVEQKAIGVARARMDVFLVPGENAAEARRYAHGVKVIPVDSFQQALRALRALPPKR